MGRKRFSRERLTRGIDPELMIRLFRCVDEMAPEDRSNYEARSIRLIAFLHDEGIRDDETSDHAQILVSFGRRMEALAKLRTHPKYRGWTLQISDSDQDPDLIHQMLIEVAAEAPLIEQRDDDIFDPDDFFDRVLAKVESGGRG
ncbi:MAG: hypothetical protein RIC85_00415 [Gammaproteobacteria bacterium]